jgi:Ca2+-binding EF-hand superfamily protein
MGSNASILLQKEEIDEIVKETGFTSNQVKRLYNRFTNLDKDETGYLSKSILTRIPELHVNPLRDRIIEVLINDIGSDGKLNFRQFAKVLATFRRKTASSTSSHHHHHDDVHEPNSRENKLRFIFDVYDRDKDNKINKSELLSILNLLVGANLPEEQMNAIAERTIAELGPQSEIESGISYEKFCNTLTKIDIDEKMSMKFLS